MARGADIRTSKIRECFLSGIDSTQCLIHAIRLYDPLENSVDEVFISDFAFKVICNSDDQEVARFWKAYKQALSKGYTDAGFVAELKKEMSIQRMGLALIVFPCTSYTCFLSWTPPLAKMFGDLRVWCLARVPLPAKVVKSAQNQLPVIIGNHDWPWMNKRWLIANPPVQQKPVVMAQPPHNEIVMKFAMTEWGNPPDLFERITNSDTVAGYELIRQLVI